MALDYGSVWKRNDDPERIATFVDPSLRAKLAGTTTIGDARLTDVLVGFQLLAGADYPLRDSVSLGVKLRWVDFGGFESKRSCGISSAATSPTWVAARTSAIG